MKPRAFILEPVAGNIDTSSCLNYGEQEVLFPQGCPLPASHERFRQVLLDKLDDIEYNADLDFFVIAGKLAKVCKAAITIADNWAGASYLFFSEAEGRYVADKMPVGI